MEELLCLTIEVEVVKIVDTHLKEAVCILKNISAIDVACIIARCAGKMDAQAAAQEAVST